MDEKKCSECGRMLPTSEFNKNRNNKDGLQDRCRDCFSAYNKKRYAGMRERTKRMVAEYRRDNPGNVLSTRLATCKRNPTKQNAQKALSEAIAAGVVENPQVCYGCGCEPPEHRIEAHHHDYTKPLEVIWLCTPCHSRMDAQRRVREGKPPYGRSKHR